MRHSGSNAHNTGEVRGLSLWPVILGLSCAGAWAVAVEPELAPIRPFVIGWFLFVCPGMALVRLIRPPAAVSIWMLTFALSLTTEALVAAGMLYTGTWSASRGLMLLISLTMAGTVAQSMRDRVAMSRTAPAVVIGAPKAVQASSQGGSSTTAPMHRHNARLAGLILVVSLLMPIGVLTFTVLRGDLVAPDATAAGSQPSAAHGGNALGLALGPIVETLAGSQSTPLGVAIAVILFALLIQQEAFHLAGQARRRDVVLLLLLVAFVSIVCMRLGRLMRLF